MYTTNENTAQEKSKSLVAHNQCYELLYDHNSNRIYLTIKGFWKNKSVASTYLSDLKKAIQLTKPGFTLLLDLHTMITHPPLVLSLHVEAQKLLVAAGLKLAASVDPADHIASLQIEDMANQSQMPIKRFSSLVEAEIWINSQ
ncbi:hypothetical protein [Pontibacter akesuensis]|uniref:SpoIIAA-like n=1 Tax=Pontibacter akesuensis TaxID=388950 RepID=A0A1I7I089_9BACT|nr:hypothetical protein [Pontibacter akesuensis]GHA64506.1 hypothetical protein GCM10007389_16530 [Pontibacter akesuensis]SFU66350.1 hypothetical protein SAMN04487941_1814 [Pontibacter akesuensis]